MTHVLGQSSSDYLCWQPSGYALYNRPIKTKSKRKSSSDLQIGSGLDAGELVGQGVHGRAVLQQLVQHKVQQGGLAVCALHVCQLQQRIQLEPCNT